MSTKKSTKKVEEPVSEEQTQSVESKTETPNFPVTVLVSKGGDSIPVTVSDQAKLDRLIGEHGAESVKVQS